MHALPKGTIQHARLRGSNSNSSLRLLGESHMSRRFDVECSCGAEFSAIRSSISVECPACGKTAMMVDLTTTYYARPITRGAA